MVNGYFDLGQDDDNFWRYSLILKNIFPTKLATYSYGASKIGMFV
jgi:hypothetical protein